MLSVPVSTAHVGELCSKVSEEGVSCHGSCYSQCEGSDLFMQVHEEDLACPLAEFLYGGCIVSLEVKCHCTPGSE